MGSKLFKESSKSLDVKKRGQLEWKDVRENDKLIRVSVHEYDNEC